VSAADPVDRATGRLVHLPDAPFLVGDLDPAEILAAYVDGPVIVDNDVNWAARAERDALAATPVSDFAYVFLGEGLGAARRNLPSSTSVRNCHHRYPCEAAWPGRPTEPGSPSEGTGEIALLETGSWKIQARFEVEDLVNALAIDPAGRVAVATSGSILIVRSPDGELLHRLDGHLSSISAVGWTADERLFSGGYDGQVIRWDLDGNQPALTVDPGPGAVWDLAIDGDELMTVTSVGSLAWHLHTTGQTRCRVALDTALSSCSLSSRGGLAAVGGAAGVAVFRRMPVRRGL
jgi:hypothetical protein